MTEPGAGSDANSGKTKAIFNADKSKFILNGQKCGLPILDLQMFSLCFAKLRMTPIFLAIVHKEWGVKLGAEENLVFMVHLQDKCF